MLVKLLITYLKVVIDFIYIWYESKRNTILQTTFQRSKDQDCNRSKLRTLKPLFPQWKTVHFGELSIQFSSVQSLSRVWLFATPWIAARQASLSITNSWSLLKLMSIESVTPSSHLILCHPQSLPALRSVPMSQLIEVAKVLELQLQHQSFQWRPRTDFL